MKTIVCMTEMFQQMDSDPSPLNPPYFCFRFR